MGTTEVTCPISVLGYTVEEVQRYGGEGLTALKDARLALIRGGRPLVERYIGMKRYDGYYQREDHTYGYGPKHGGIVFQVSLKPEVRSRLRDNPDATLSPDEIEAGLALLGVDGLEQVRLKMLTDETERLRQCRSRARVLLDELLDGVERDGIRRSLDEVIRNGLDARTVITQLEAASTMHH